MPRYLEKVDLFGPVGYKWTTELGGKFYAAEDQNVKLCQAIDKASFKAKLAIGVAVGEWSLWRYQGLMDLSDANNRLEAAWANVIHPFYSKSLQIDLRPPLALKNPEIEKPFELAVCLLGETRAHYATGNIYLAAAVVKQVMLARHVIADKQRFDSWFSDAIRRSSEVFPRGREYDTQTQKYDASHEIPVPREFYESGFVYRPEVGKQVLQEFLKTLDYTKNPYLRSPEEMKEKGFQGTPYVL